MGSISAPIPFLSPDPTPTDAIERYFALARDARWFSNEGPCYRLFAERAREYLGGDVEVVPVANCTLGLMLSLRALAGRPSARHTEVIVPSFTFVGSAAAIDWAGFTPFFVDVDAECWHLSADALAEALSDRGDRAVAVLGCSTFGVAPPHRVSRAWSHLAADAGVPLLIDSAAGFGSRDERGCPLGRQGDAEAFSFHATKPFAIGEGGAVVTEDKRLAERIRKLTNFGFNADRVVADDIGINAKMDEWHAAACLAALDVIDQVVDLRARHAATLRSTLEDAGYRFQLGSEGSAWQFVPVVAPSHAVRETALARCREAKIEVRTYFDPPLHRMKALAGYASGPLEVTDDLARRALSLPMANDLSPEAIDRITTALCAAIESEAVRR